MKTKPNQPCPCGSGIKFKKCHGSPVKVVEKKVTVSELLKQSDALLLNNQLDAAENAIQEAIRLAPASLDAWQALGNLAEKLGDFEAAKECYQHLLTLDPTSVLGYFLLGNLFYRLSAFLEAQKAYKQAIHINQQLPEVWGNLGNVEKYLGNFQEAINCYYRSVACHTDVTQKARLHSNLLFSLHYDQTLSHDIIFQAHRKWAADYAQDYYPIHPAWLNSTEPKRQLRLGYVSGSFNGLIVGHFLDSVFSAHNPENFHLIVYSSTLHKDAKTEKLSQLCQEWVDIVHLDDDAVAERIQRDAIDILIDLDGHSPTGRPLLFARKPSPIQVAWLDYFNTTGMAAMDYIITDTFTTPIDSPQCFSETVIRLPDTRFCYTPPVYAPAVSEIPCLAGKAFTFGSFNRQDKLHPELIRIWAEILHATPGSRLLLKNRALGVPAVKAALEARFSQQGISIERLILRGASPHVDMLLEYSDIDVALDTFPYNGGLTSCECLWMGIPIIALEGQRMVERQTSSMLRLLGLDAWVASSIDAYIALAVKASLTQNHAKLTLLRHQLRAQMAASLLCDATRFTQNLEAAYRFMWEVYCKNNPASL
ncbi:MAG: tetratricopeptide repeat protein [Methylococcaceae bacterium]